MEKTYSITSSEPIYLVVIKKKTLKVSVVVITLFLIVGSVPFFRGTRAIASQISTKIACSKYVNQEQAQKTLETNPVKYKNLDRNHDGKACTSYHYETI